MKLPYTSVVRASVIRHRSGRGHDVAIEWSDGEYATWRGAEPTGMGKFQAEAVARDARRYGAGYVRWLRS